MYALNIQKEKIMQRLQNYKHTIWASYLGYITQAIVINFAPLLFLTFSKTFHLSLDKITMMTTVNFLVQLLVDFLATKFVDKIGYRTCIVAAHIFDVVGLVGLAVLPFIMPPFAGLMIAVVLYAIGGGLIEVLISPILEACPTENKEGEMSLLHSFYCWGFLFVVLVSTAFFAVFGTDKWWILALVWAVVPLVNTFYFACVPIYPVVKAGEETPFFELLKTKVFWLLLVIMVCAGAAEQAIAQWVSTFAESGLHVSKTVGDLAGPCAFAACMGAARSLYGEFSEKLPLKPAMIACAALCIACYLVAAFAQNAIFALVGCALCGFSVGIFWPGTFSAAAVRLPTGGIAMYALMALAGDLGCSAGPTLVGLIASANGNSLSAGLAVAIIFPIVILLGISLLKIGKKKE